MTPARWAGQVPVGQFLTVPYAALLLGVHPDAVRQAITDGRLTPVRFTLRGVPHVRLDRDDLAPAVTGLVPAGPDPTGVAGPRPVVAEGGSR